MYVICYNIKNVFNNAYYYLTGLLIEDVTRRMYAKVLKYPEYVKFIFVFTFYDLTW